MTTAAVGVNGPVRVAIPDELRGHMRWLRIPIPMVPGWGGVIAFALAIVIYPIFFLIAALGGNFLGLGLFLFGLYVVLLMPPLVVMRFFAPWGLGQYQHDLSAEEMVRAQGRPEIKGMAVNVGGTWIYPRVDARQVAAAAQGKPWVQVDAGLSGAVVYAVRDQAGNLLYDFRHRSGPSKRLWAVAIGSSGWTILLTFLSTLFVQWAGGTNRAHLPADRALAAAYARAPSCQTGGEDCYTLTPTTVQSAKRGEGGTNCVLGFQSPVTLMANMSDDCSNLPSVNTAVTVKTWRNAVTSITVKGKETLAGDSPPAELAGNVGFLDGLTGFEVIGFVAPVLYSLGLAGGHLWWRRVRSRIKVIV